MIVSVLITTFNRSELLRRALASVLQQDYENICVTVIDDCSTDDTAETVRSFSDPRVSYVRNSENVGGTHGDLAIIRRFLSEFCDGDAFIYLCDDDYWRPSDMISRQVAAFKVHPSLAFVQGGMAHCYPHPVPTLGPNEDYVTYSHVDGDNSMVFWGTIFPDGFIPGKQYLRWLAEDPKNRNIVIGATLFSTTKFKASGALDRAFAAGVRWQAGYAILAGAATQGDVFYIDEPCVMNAVTIDNASHRGTQLEHMNDCLASITAAFGTNNADPDMRDIRRTMARSVFKIFICNKIAAKAGWFKENAIGSIEHIMQPAITETQFLATMEAHDVPLSKDNRQLIQWSDILDKHGMEGAAWWRGVLAMAS